METWLVPIGPQAWRIEDDGGCLGELRKINGLFVIIPTTGSSLDEVKGGYSTQAAAMSAIMERTGGMCHLRKEQCRVDQEET